MSSHRLSKKQIDKLCEMRERGLSCAQIGLRLGVSRGAVAWHCLRLGAEPPNAGPVRLQKSQLLVSKRGPFDVRRFSAQEDTTIREMKALGASNAEISRKLGRKHNSITGRLMTLARHEERGVI